MLLLFGSTIGAFKGDVSDFFVSILGAILNCVELVFWDNAFLGAEGSSLTLRVSCEVVESVGVVRCCQKFLIGPKKLSKKLGAFSFSPYKMHS